MTAPPTKEELLARLEAVIPRLRAHAERPAPSGLTGPDEPSGERWEAGQAWAHLAEFIPYWIGQLRGILAGPGPEPVPFGRVKTDAVRTEPIERDRHVPIDDLWARMEGQFVELRAFIDGLSPEDWTRRGLHRTLGPMHMPTMVERFIVGHLEEHADQLDALVASIG
jgi:hypothetical protein